MEIFLFFIIGYFFGCFQSAYVLVKLRTGKDIKLIGSGNPGTANVLLNFGAYFGVAVLFCDMMKTIIPAIICSLTASKTDNLIAAAICCTGVFTGHCFPFNCKFKGGKGIASAVAFSLVLDFRIFLIAILTAALFAFFVRSLTYGSYTFALMLYVCSIVFGYEPIIVLCTLFQSIIIVVLHLMRKPNNAPLTA